LTLEADMRVVDLAAVLALALSSCVPDVVGIEAVPTGKFARDLAQCNAEAAKALISGTLAERCLKAKGYKFLRRY
jgi:hypothetical protein